MSNYCTSLCIKNISMQPGTNNPTIAQGEKITGISSLPISICPIQTEAPIPQKPKGKRKKGMVQLAMNNKHQDAVKSKADGIHGRCD